MTPKEKAEELFYTITLIILDTSFGVNKKGVKKLALHQVDEILNVTIGLNDFTDDFEYWTQVKQEIETL
jgi:hypothetical protein